MGSVTKNPARLGLGVVTGGSSELARSVKGKESFFDPLLTATGLKKQKESMSGELDAAQALLMKSASGENPLVNKQYQEMAKQGLANTLATINSQRPLQASERANLAARATRDTQQEAASQGGLLAAEDQDRARNALANFLLSRSGASNNLETARADRLAGLLGKGASAAGAMGGKPPTA